MRKTVRIDLVSDIACPWCAIGYARLQRALAELTDEVEVELHWRPFELNPDPALQPEPILPALCRKYGMAEAEMRANQQHLLQIAGGLGLDFRALENRLTCNTFDAHRLLHWAALQNGQTALKLQLFAAYFGYGLQISEQAVLLACVEKAGLDPLAAATVLNSDQFVAEVRQEQQWYLQAGIQSVPAFIINQQYLVSGAQEPAVLVNTLRQVSAYEPQR